MNFNMPPVTKHLLIINLLMLLAKVVAERYGIDFDDLFGLHFFMASDFRLHQLFTYMFAHANFMHLFFNMFAVWMFGRIMEQVMGSRRFLIYYIVCGLGAGIVQEVAQYVEYLYAGLDAYDTVDLGGMVVSMDAYLNRWTTVGASGSVYGVLLSFGMTFPEERIFIFPLPVPIKAKYFVMGYAVIELLSALSQKGDGVAHMAHLGGMLVGFLLLLYWRGGGGKGSRGGYRSYGRDDNSWDGFRRWFSSLGSRLSALWKRKQPHIDVTYGGQYNRETAYRQQKKQEEEELNRILDKIKKSGYSGLTDEEKRRLFDISKK